ncbi:DNA polymerase iota isoform X2 [Microcaecilia unicolor]|uniref:DNA polymerase iota isoform X2 n=1 Tax=Microcaecilia unicolor TaxID=1415580 RepID=A0A6P7XDX6_9AMPH|nr:DNA polymerase iota isoform X2 [Microcaecilia unicolor]
MDLSKTSDEEQEGNEDDEETDWLVSNDDTQRRVWIPGAAEGRLLLGKVEKRGIPVHRVIVHIDMDCFYAQVEMIRNPELREKPLGVQQKHVVVTCNYEARKHGVHKLMSVRNAKEKCPQLVLVSGEDLTNYREISYKATALNLSDVMHLRLAVGSQIAAEMRETLYNRLGLTCCAGVASNKLLSKLVCGTFKPNQQTVLLPESCQRMMGSLEHLGKVPGIGYKTTKRLESLGLSSLSDLQTCFLPMLEKELGSSVAQRIYMLSHGEDNSAVIPSGPPQSLSDEDSFRKCSTEAEVEKKIEELLMNLLDRICKDGRKPHTVRLTLRQFSPTNKWFNRESRQCPVPTHLIQKFGARNSDIVAPLVDLLMKLFHKMINVKVPFHLTLLNVCFCNLKATSSITKGSIAFYLAQKKSFDPDSDQCIQKKLTADTEDLSQTKDNCLELDLFSGKSTYTRAPFIDTITKTEAKGICEFPFHQLPVGIDWDVFSQLPEDIKKEILSNPGSSLNQPSAKYKGMQSFAPKNVEITSLEFKKNDHNTESISVPYSKNSQGNFPVEVKHDQLRLNYVSSTCEQKKCPDREFFDECVRQNSQTLHSASMQLACTNFQNQLFQKSLVTDGHVQTKYAGSELDSLMNPVERAHGKAEITFPSSVDPKVFSELPAEIQNELRAEWKRQELFSKIAVKHDENKMKATKGKQSIPKSPVSNSLLKYFKPNESTLNTRKH